ncbi:MAG: peptidoglycan DD-metalloendopeptidase family protein [Pseudomonadota bacterium]
MRLDIIHAVFRTFCKLVCLLDLENGYCELMAYTTAILNQAYCRLPRHPGLKIGAVLSAMLLGVVTVFGLSPNTAIYSGPATEVLDAIHPPAIHFVQPSNTTIVREVRIQHSDTVAALLSEMGVDDDTAWRYLRTDPDADLIFRQLVPGRTLTAQVATNGALQQLVFPLSGERNTALQIARTAAGFNTITHELSGETRVVMQSAEIRHSLFGAADDIGMPDAVAVQLADIFGGDIDFHRDLRKGDRFAVVYESVTHTGNSTHSLRVLAAEFVNAGKSYRAFWFQDGDSKGGYYTPEGQNVKKAFLRSPLEFSRISSGYSNARRHPVLGKVRAHRGIDYAAPTGTRVKATSDGIVEFVGRQGGYGNVITLRHPANKTTVYGHLSKFAAGLKKGSRVSQGDVIGFVGATGLATGPHLHYEFRVAGTHRNPLTVVLPSGKPLSPTELPVYLHHIAALAPQIAAAQRVQYVMLD